MLTCAVFLVVFVLSCSFISSTSAFSLQVYNDSACTLSLPNYSYTNAQLNYTTPSPVCLNGTIAGSQPVMQSLSYTCSYTTTPPLVNINLNSYTQPDCSGDGSWSVYISGNQSTGASGGLQGVCVPMHLYAQNSTLLVTVYGVGKCAATNSNSGARSVEGTAGLMTVLLIVVGSLLH